MVRTYRRTFGRVTADRITDATGIGGIAVAFDMTTLTTVDVTIPDEASPDDVAAVDQYMSDQGFDPAV